MPLCYYYINLSSNRDSVYHRNLLMTAHDGLWVGMPDSFMLKMSIRNIYMVISIFLHISMPRCIVKSYSSYLKSHCKHKICWNMLIILCITVGIIPKEDSTTWLNILWIKILSLLSMISFCIYAWIYQCTSSWIGNIVHNACKI